VFSVPHESLGEDVGAVVHLRAGASARTDDFIAHCQAILAPYKVPAHLWISADPLPKGGTGKLLKREVRARYAAPTT
jgi:acyl-CoA synthetase (AMP-forming)/AMP-acid ligase II